MNEYGATEPTDDETRPIEGVTPEQAPSTPAPRLYATAPTWEWTGTQPTALPPYATQPPTVPPYGGYAPPMPVAPVAPRSGISRRARGLGVAAAVLLVGGAAAGGAAFGFAHGHDGASAAGIASGESGVTAPQVPGQSPSQGPSSEAPSNGGNGQSPRHRRDGRSSSYIPPGHATTAQQVGVVDINTKLKYQSAKAAGTGMILTSDGQILTNNHVVEGATKIKVIVVATGKSYDATVVGTDKVDDVAVLQLTDASGLATITQDTDQVKVGDAVTAVGNAMGAGGIPSAAAGHVVGLNRSITTQSEGGVEGERLTGMIQVDAQVIAGDSGGPLYDAQNEVIGMDTAASSSPMQSLGFAIPIAKALSIADQIQSGQAGGNIVLGVPAFLGIQFQPGSSGSGAVIAGVVPKTPAAGLGLLPGDTITRLSGSTVTSGEQLKTLLLNYRGGDSVSLTWTDSQGGSHTASVTLIDGPAD
jgi:S1-C subfamily serine protease